MKEKKDGLQQNPELFWAEVIKTNKFNINGEKNNIDKYTQGRELLAKQLKETEKGLELDLEETKIIKKLYPKFGKGYEETDEFKKFFVKKMDFIIDNINNKKGSARKQYSYQLGVSARSIAESERLIKEYKGRVKEAVQKRKDSIKDKDKMFG